MLSLFIIAIALAVIISVLLAEAEAESTQVPFYSPVIPPGMKIRLKHLVRRVRYDGVPLVRRWLVRLLGNKVVARYRLN